MHGVVNGARGAIVACGAVGSETETDCMDGTESAGSHDGDGDVGGMDENGEIDDRDDDVHDVKGSGIAARDGAGTVFGLGTKV